MRADGQRTAASARRQRLKPRGDGVMLVFINFGGGGRYWWLGPLFGIGFSFINTALQEVRVLLRLGDGRRGLRGSVEP